MERPRFVEHLYGTCNPFWMLDPGSRSANDRTLVANSELAVCSWALEAGGSAFASVLDPLAALRCPALAQPVNSPPVSDRLRNTARTVRRLALPGQRLSVFSSGYNSSAFPFGVQRWRTAWACSPGVRLTDSLGVGCRSAFYGVRWPICTASWSQARVRSVLRPSSVTGAKPRARSCSRTKVRVGR